MDYLQGNSGNSAFNRVLGGSVEQQNAGLKLISKKKCEVIMEVIKDMYVEGVESQRRKALLEHSVEVLMTTRTSRP